MDDHLLPIPMSPETSSGPGDLRSIVVRPLSRQVTLLLVTGRLPSLTDTLEQNTKSTYT